MGSGLIFLHFMVRLKQRDGLFEEVARLDECVPQGRGRFDPEASDNGLKK